MRKTTAFTTLSLAATLALSSCAANPAVSADTRLDVVASTTVYADLARQIGGEDIKTSAIITRTAQDPHSYEATPRDMLAVSKADVVIENGGGYDSFMEPMIDSAAQPDDRVISVVDLAPAEKLAEAAEDHADHDHAHDAEHDDHHGHHHGEFNEHLWYDLPTMRALVVKIAATLSATDPGNAERFAENATRLDAELQALEGRLTALKQSTQDKAFASTEPLPTYLLSAAGLSDQTPDGFGEAIEGGSEVPPLVVKEFKTALERGEVDLLAVNTQTASAQTDAIAKQAKELGIPVLEFTETLPEPLDFQGWMNENIAALEAAPGIGTR